MAHGHRDNRAGEHHIGDIGQITLYCIFMALWISDVIFKYSNFLNEYVPSVIRLPLGIVILTISGYMAGTGLWLIFGRKLQSQGVVRKGVFSFVRHPIYLSEILLYLGLLLINISLAAALIWIIAMFFLHYISRYEEKLLLEKFGEEYRLYIKEVPMWFPQFYRRK